MKYVLVGPIDNNPALVQMMAWHQTGAKPLSEPMVVQFNDIYASLALNGLKEKIISVEYLHLWDHFSPMRQTIT